MSKEVKFNFTVGRTPLPKKTALMVDSQLNLFSVSQPSMTRGKRLIACEQNHSTCFPHDTSRQLPTTRAFLCIRRARRGGIMLRCRLYPLV